MRSRAIEEAKTNPEEGSEATSRWLVVLLGAFLFYLPNQAQFGGGEPLVRGLNTANILFLLILAAMLKNGGSSGGSTASRTPLKGSLSFFFSILTLSLFIGLATDSSTWIDDITVFKNCVFYVLLYFLYYHAVRDLSTVRFLFLMILFVSLTSAILGLRQAIDYGIGNYNETRRVAAPFGWGYFAANRSAIFFCISFPILLATALLLKSRLWLRLACLATAALVVFVVFHTYSRQAYFILAVVALALALRRNLLAAALITVALLNYEAWVPETVVERIEMTKAEPEPASSSSGEEQRFDVSTESRFIVWEGAGQMILSSPWGIGFNHFKREIGAYVPAFLAGKDAHNFYVLFTTEAGIIAPVALLVLFLSFIRLGIRALRVDASDESQVLGVGYLLAILAVALGNLYGSRFLDGEVMTNFWILSALVAKYSALKEAATMRDANVRLHSGGASLGKGARPGRSLSKRP